MAAYKLRITDDVLEESASTACPRGLKEEDMVGTPNIPGYLIFTRLTGTVGGCLGCCVASIGGSNVIHTTLYLPVLEQTFTAVKDTGSRCRDVHDFNDLKQLGSQDIYEFRMTYDQFCRVKASIYKHLNETYDDCMFGFGWVHFFCDTDFMETCCTRRDTQTCSRFVLNALIDGDVVTGVEKRMFVLPADVETIVKQRRFEFQFVQWQEMCDHTNRWYEQTRTARRGVHTIYEDKGFLSLSTSAEMYQPVAVAKMALPAAGRVYYPQPQNDMCYDYSDNARSTADSGSAYSYRPYSVVSSTDSFDASQYIYLDNNEDGGSITAGYD